VGRHGRGPGPYLYEVKDGYACDQNATGAATENVFANDVRLRDLVPTPGSGTEPRLAFSVAADGRVTP